MKIVARLVLAGLIVALVAVGINTATGSKAPAAEAAVPNCYQAWYPYFDGPAHVYCQNLAWYGREFIQFKGSVSRNVAPPRIYDAYEVYARGKSWNANYEYICILGPAHPEDMVYAYVDSRQQPRKVTQALSFDYSEVTDPDIIDFTGYYGGAGWYCSWVAYDGTVMLVTDYVREFFQEHIDAAP